MSDWRSRSYFFSSALVVGELFALQRGKRFQAALFETGLIFECPFCVECLLRALLALSASIVVPRRTTTPRFRFRKWAYIKSHRDNGLSISLTVPCPLKKCKHSTQRKTYINTGQRDNKLTHPACSKISSHLTSHQNMLETKMHRHCTLICTG